jgi:hypothetical protein
LVSIRSLLERMRTNDKAKSLVFLDAVQPRTSPRWRVPDIRPGLGSLSREADPEKLQIALVDVVPERGGSAGLLTVAMVRRLQPERIKLPQLAILVQQDVSVDTGGMYAPRVFGSVSGSLELQRLTTEEFQTKAKKCLDQRQQATEATITQASTTSADASDASLQLAGTDASHNQVYRVWDWFCPDYAPPQVYRQRRWPVSSGSAGARAVSAHPRSLYVGGGFGGGHTRSAASGVPTP